MAWRQKAAAEPFKCNTKLVQCNDLFSRAVNRKEKKTFYSKRNGLLELRMKCFYIWRINIRSKMYIRPDTFLSHLHSKATGLRPRESVTSFGVRFGSRTLEIRTISFENMLHGILSIYYVIEECDFQFKKYYI
jgi:hypothetical protein